MAYRVVQIDSAKIVFTYNSSAAQTEWQTDGQTDKLAFTAYK